MLDDLTTPLLITLSAKNRLVNTLAGCGSRLGEAAGYRPDAILECLPLPYNTALSIAGRNPTDAEVIS
jgi:hypothetical protein